MRKEKHIGLGQEPSKSMTLSQMKLTKKMQSGKKTTTFLLHFQPFMGILCLSFRTFLSRDPRPGLNQASWSLDPQNQKLGMVNCDLERVGSKLERFKGSNILMPYLCINIHIYINTSSSRASRGRKFQKKKRTI